MPEFLYGRFLHSFMQFPSALNSDNQESRIRVTFADHHGASTKGLEKADLGDRFQIHHLHLSSTSLSEHHDDDAQVVIQGLSACPKTLPPRFFYDDRGSQLFEQICQLPEYYLTRTETHIFQACADELAQLTGACEIVELGSGSSTKTRIILHINRLLCRFAMCLLMLAKEFYAIVLSIC